MTNRLKLTNAGQNSGVGLILLGSKITYNWNNLFKDFPRPNQYQGTMDVQFSGWKNPQYNITFYIELTTPTSGAITWTQFNMMVRDTINKTYLTLTFGNSDTSFSSFAGVASTVSTGVTTIPIYITDFNVTIDPNIRDELFITMNCVERV